MKLKKNKMYLMVLMPHDSIFTVDTIPSLTRKQRTNHLHKRMLTKTPIFINPIEVNTT